MAQSKAVSACEAGTHGGFWMVVGLADVAEGGSLVDILGVVVEVARFSFFGVFSGLLKRGFGVGVLVEFMVEEGPFVGFVLVVLGSYKKGV